MTKNKVKIIAIILAILLICSGIIFLATSNRTMAYTNRDIIPIGQSVSNFGSMSTYYCLNKGWVYEPGNYVMIGTGTLDPLVAYAIGYEQYERQLGKIDANDHTSTNLSNNANNDAIANIIWDMMGSGRPHRDEPYISEEFQQILAQAEIIQNLSTNDVSITSTETMLIGNADGEYGPFTINYPNIDGNLVGVDLNIIVNGTTVVAIEDLIKKADGYYLTEAHGIQLGVENTIELQYTANRYSGIYYEYTKEREIAIEAICSECRGTGTLESLGIYDCSTGTVEKNEDVDWTGTIAHTTECSGASAIYAQGNAYPIYPYYQDIIEPLVTPQSVRLGANINFWVGTPDLEINFNKVNTEGENVEGAKFDVSITGGALESGETSITTVIGGNILRIQPNKGSTAISVTLTETDAPEEYAILENPIILQYNWNNITKQWDCDTKDFEFPTGEKVTIEQNATYDAEDNATKYDVTAENKRKIIVNLLKTDNASSVLENMSFDIEVTGGSCEETSIITDSNGEAQIVIVPDSTSDVKLTLTEKDAKGYKKLDPIEITFRYRAGKWQTTVNNEVKEQVTIDGTIAIFDLEIVNIPIIEEVTLIKINKSLKDLGLEEYLPGITFRIDLGNALTETGDDFISATTDNNGEISLGTLEIQDASKEITITLEEITTPDDGLDYGSLVNTPVTITLKHNDASSCKSNNSLVIPSYDVDKNIIEIEVQNEVTMDLSGMVWEDKQTGIKPVQPANGKKDSGESGISGVIVNLRGGLQDMIEVTDSTGNYQFTDVPASVRGAFSYYIEFTYDGINYIATTPGIDSDATEKDRAAFNNKFATIVKDNAIGTDGIPTTLEYNYNANGATLETMDGGMVKGKFAINADTLPTTYSTTTRNIDLGLVRKEVDLAAATDIVSATVRINGENKTYTDFAKLDKDEEGYPILSNPESKAQYNLYLYNSDYNYRIGDYQLPAARRDNLTVSAPGAIDVLQDQRTYDGVLNVEVTYQVLLSNRSATDATVNEIVYYYDSRYVLKTVSVDTGTISLKEPISTENIGGVTYNKAKFVINADLTDADSQRVVDLTFDVGKDSSENLYTGIMQNIVEIISYSTNSGCIDKNSAPDNLTINYNENDTDDATGLNVRLNNIERQVSGFVFEDDKPDESGQYNIGDGKYDASNSNEKKINDVIVQLIEIKDITSLRLEYIWQETVSGSNTVKVVSNDGTKQINIRYTTDRSLNGTTFNENGTTYTYKYIQEEVKDGEYKFVDFIPGDYIVRFIYGDGTYYDTAIDGEATSEEEKKNILTYNGQDYKSTLDQGYNRTVHMEGTYDSPNSSMARDNEARRLEEMAYATSVTSANDLIINSGTDTEKKDKLKETWMCADTSPILMKISDSETEGDTNSIVRNVNFGLVERPKVTLELEKHITGLHITDCGTSVHATTDLGEYKQALTNGLEVDVKNTGSESVWATATSKNDNARGRWKIETEASKLTGGTLEITYRYLVRNTGDLDYIGQELKRLLADETYTEIVTEVKKRSSQPSYTPGKYLGTAYYTGNAAASTDAPVTIAFQIEDYISSTNGLELVTTSNFEYADPGTEEKHVWEYVSSGGYRGRTSAFETVRVLQSKQNYTLEANSENSEITLTVKLEDWDTTSSADDLVYRSYAAQLICPSTGSITSTSGTICSGATLGNLATGKPDGTYHGAVQSYVEDLNVVGISDIVPESDEFIAETVVITMDTGGDKATPIFLIITITSGLAIVAVGIVLIKKFVIK